MHACANEIWPPHDVLNAVAFHTHNNQNMNENIYNDSTWLHYTQFHIEASWPLFFIKRNINDWRWTTDLACKIWYTSRWLLWFEMLLIGLMFHMNKKQNEFEIYKVYVMYSQVNSYQNYKYSWTYRRFAYIIYLE